MAASVQEQLLARLILLAGFATPADKSRAVRLPSRKSRGSAKHPAPQPAPVLACVSFVRRETALGGRLQPDCPSFPNEPLVERGGLALERANPDPPVLVVRDPAPCRRSEGRACQCARSADLAPQPRTARRRRVDQGRSDRFRGHRRRPADKSCDPFAAYRRQSRAMSAARPGPTVANNMAATRMRMYSASVG